jgi:hypothetical protein
MPPMISPRIGSIVLLLSLTGALKLVASSQQAFAITVRVLDAKNGKPIKGVGVFLVDPATYSKAAAPNAPQGLSDKNGVVILRFANQPPEKIFVQYSGGQCGLVQCSYNKGQPFSVSEILKSGVVAPNGCSDSNFQFGQVPHQGEIVIFAKMRTSWECTRQEIP